MAALGGLVVDETKIKKAIQTGIPLTVTTFTLPREIEAYIEQMIIIFLAHFGQERLKDYVVYCTNELAVNVKKANTKRAYFSERGLELDDPADYKKGMTSFKEDTLGNIAHYLQMQKEKGLYIKVILQAKGNIISIEVRNNVVITKNELIRIHDKLARSRKYETLDEALSQVLDDSEGAGLGLVILILMLKKIGLDEDCFDITRSEKETIARLTVPLDKTHVENLAALSTTIVEDISSLPQFPENISRIQELINDPKSEISDIGRQISIDPALAADLLKIVNSAYYVFAKKVDSIAEAVKIVGMRGIKNMLYSYGMQKILGDDSHDQRLLWAHSYKVAFFAYNLAKNFRKDRNLLDDVYAGGILHDMGKIIFSSVHPDLLEKIRNFCTGRGMPASTLEDFAAGMNHAEIGARVAEKWNFPGGLVACIRYHHDPESAPEEHREIVDIIYLANMFCLLENGEVSYEQLSPEVLERFGFSSERHVDAIWKKFAEGFKWKGGTR